MLPSLYSSWQLEPDIASRGWSGETAAGAFSLALAEAEGVAAAHRAGEAAGAWVQELAVTDDEQRGRERDEWYSCKRDSMGTCPRAATKLQPCGVWVPRQPPLSVGCNAAAVQLQQRDLRRLL